MTEGELINAAVPVWAPRCTSARWWNMHDSENCVWAKWSDGREYLVRAYGEHASHALTYVENLSGEIGEFCDRVGWTCRQL